MIGIHNVNLDQAAGVIVIITTLCSSLAAAIVSIINAIRTKEVKRQVQPSNGQTLAHMVEQNHEVMTTQIQPVAELAEQALPIVKEMNKNDNQ